MIISDTHNGNNTYNVYMNITIIIIIIIIIIKKVVPPQLIVIRIHQLVRILYTLC